MSIECLQPAKDEIGDAVSRAVDAAANLNRGDILPFEALESAFECQRYKGNWTYLVKKFRLKILSERGIALRPVVGVGYKFCDEDEQYLWCSKNRQRRAVRQIGRGIREVESGSTDSINEHGRRVRGLKLQQMQLQRNIIVRCVKSQNAEIRATPTIPQRPIPAR